MKKVIFKFDDLSLEQIRKIMRVKPVATIRITEPGKPVKHLIIPAIDKVRRCFK